MRRGGRVVECGGLENRFTGIPGDEGSNPSSSAIEKLRAWYTFESGGLRSPKGFEPDGKPPVRSPREEASLQAIILAAGMGKRLGELTSNNTKCMVEVNGVTLIERMLSQLDSLQPPLSRIIIVIGYEGEKLKAHVASLPLETAVEYITNEDFATTNNIVSLALTKDWLAKEDTLLLESDLIFEDGILEELVNDERPTLALVDKYASWMDGAVVKIDAKDNILAFVPGTKFALEDIPHYYKTVNIYKFGKEFSESHYLPFLEAYSKAYGDNEYYEQVLRVLIMLDDSEVKAKRLDGHQWYEIDDIQDLDIASSMFHADPEEHLKKIMERYGGYWRYPKLLDFCYLVNPYYPPKRLCDEIKAEFDRLVTEYPSGFGVNSLLAAKNFSLNRDYVLVGNGAAELIASLLRFVATPVGMIKPTFDEYPNRARRMDVETFIPQTSDLSYSARDVIEHFDETSIQSLVLINPDNPSGNYLPRGDLQAILEWAQQKSITLILDESFSDFSDEPDNSCLKDSLLEAYPNLVVVKSISKSYGIPGLRLGIMASANQETVSSVRRDVAIWNVNSFGEFYLQIAEKYKPDYEQGLGRFREERKRFLGELGRIDGLSVVPTQANFVMVKTPESMPSKDLAVRLLSEWGILIKDLSGKAVPSAHYIRLAIRSSEDNDRLLAALRSILDRA